MSHREPVAAAPIPVQLCPYCSTFVNCSGHTAHAETAVQASPGDLAVCNACAGVMRFDRTLRLIIPTPEEVRTVTRLNPQLGIDLWQQRQAVLRRSVNFVQPRTGPPPRAGRGRNSPRPGDTTGDTTGDTIRGGKS